MRAAASSSASGRLSRRAQSSVDRLSIVRCAGSSARARVTNSSTPSSSPSVGNRVDVLALELEALTTRDEDRRAGDVSKRARSRAATSGSRCSALSRRSSARFPTRRSAEDLAELAARPAPRPGAPARGQGRAGCVAQRRQRHPPDAVGIRLRRLGRRLEREAASSPSRPAPSASEGGARRAAGARRPRPARARARGTGSPAAGRFV